MMTIDEVLAMDEKQIFDRKSIKIKPTDLSDTICAFANADGGTVAIGISDKHRKIEGVDRMCKELEAIGLPAPVFNNNTFILKTTVMSASFKSKMTDNVSIQPEHTLIEKNDASIYGKDALLEKLHQIEAAGKISHKNAMDAAIVIENIDIMQIVTSKEVMKFLSCQTTKARMVLKMMEA